MKRVYFLILIIISINPFWSCDKEEEITLPQTNFVIDSLIATKGIEVHFFNQTTNATSYLWDFGDGTTSNEKEPIHIYYDSGWHEIKLTATNESGSTFSTEDLLVKDITVMTYNIAFSGGAITELYDLWREDYVEWIYDRRPQLIKIIRSANPDVLAIQEAFLWDSYAPKVYERFADSLDMPYYYFPEYDEAEFNGICIYSKFPIVSTDFLLHQPCVPNRVFNGAFMVKAKLKIDNSKYIDVLSCHLSAEGKEITTCEIQMLHDYLKDSIFENTILLGDMNFGLYPEFTDNDERIVLLEDLGLKFLDKSGIADIDQIWATKKLSEKSLIFHKSGVQRYGLSSFFNSDIRKLFPTASDHKPAIAHFGL